MPQLCPAVFKFVLMHLFCVIIIHVNSHQIGNNFREGMQKKLTPYSMVKLSISWNKTTDNFCLMTILRMCLIGAFSA